MKTLERNTKGERVQNREAMPPGKKKRKIHPLFTVLFCMGLIAMGGALWLRFAVKPPAENPLLNDPSLRIGGQQPGGGARPVPGTVKENFYTFVLAGLDPEGYNTDVLMVAAFDADKGQLHVVNIPRDTQVTGANGKVRKINASWTLGAEEQLKGDLQKIIGFAPSNTMLVNIKGFVRLVNAVDGVDFDVPQDMNHRDPIVERQIHLEKGPQHLTGEKALQLVRFRGYNGGVPDYQRIQMTQDFLKAVAKKTLTPGSLFKLPEFIGIANENVKTALTATEMMWFAQRMMKLDSENIHFHTLEGDPSYYYKRQNYVLLDEKTVLDVVNKTVNPFTKDITKDNLALSRTYDEKR